MMEISILVGGKAGDGIRAATTLLGRILSRYGYRIFVYDDYPSLIRGGHNFSILRAADHKIYSNRKVVDVLVAFDGKTLEKHLDKVKEDGILIYDEGDKALSEKVSSLSIKSKGVNLKAILEEFGAREVMKNTAAIAYTAKTLGIEFEVVKATIEKFVKNPEINIRIAERAYELAEEEMRVEKLEQEVLPAVLGNEAIALGALAAGLQAYYAYPMTPSTSILHYLAALSREAGVLVVQPENEIAVMLMALGSVYAGRKTMVATSGGGFALMVEGLSLAGQAELPIVIVVSQRAGPSTGVPTYTMQADLHFILNAGHGEFPRFVVAPGDAEEAFSLTALAMNIAWKYQIPAFVISDKHLSESLYSFEIVDGVYEEETKLWNGERDYRRYELTDEGVSPLAFPGEAVVKSNSYAHDEYGITTENAEMIARMQEKNLRKRRALKKEVEGLKSVNVYGDSEEAIITWGSTKGVCVEAAKELGLKVIQPLILEPFTVNEAFQAEKKAVVELNSTGQLARLLRANGINYDATILKYDARPFFLEDLVERLKEVFP
jgi:2-oxoglutarate ferredoxin oxidoreductase subunit alpha